MPVPLTRRNAMALIDELERLVETTPADEVTPEAQDRAARLLAALSLSPGPRGPVEETLNRLRAWSETMFMQATHARHGAVKSGIVADIAALRGLVEEDE
jgi:predicted ArsR family transcriptional regulator